VYLPFEQVLCKSRVEAEKMFWKKKNQQLMGTLI